MAVGRSGALGPPAVQRRAQFALQHRRDERADPLAYPGLRRIEPVVTPRWNRGVVGCSLLQGVISWRRWPDRRCGFFTFRRLRRQTISYPPSDTTPGFRGRGDQLEDHRFGGFPRERAFGPEGRVPKGREHAFAGISDSIRHNTVAIRQMGHDGQTVYLILISPGETLVPFGRAVFSEFITKAKLI